MLSLFVLQASLTTVRLCFAMVIQLMIHKKSFNARIIFSVMVPISILAFFLASLTVEFNQHLDTFDYVSSTITISRSE